MTPAPTNKDAECPPLPVKQAIEKSVQYVLKNGPSFEEKLRQNDGNGQFAFLSPDNQYFAYYKATLAAVQANEKPEKDSSSVSNEKTAETPAKPAHLLFLTELPPLSEQDLEVIKATASYVACNSAKHQDALHKFMDRKGRRNQFAFMNKSHTLHALFQTYVSQYKAIIDKTNGASESDSARLIDSYISGTQQDFFERSYRRAAFEKRHKVTQKNQEQDLKNRQMHYASIDWQDFSFVSKVNFDAIDEVSELPVPLSRESVVYRSLEAKTKDLELTVAEAPKDLQPSAASSQQRSEGVEDEDKNTESAVPEPSNLPKGMKIKAAGESRLKRKATGVKSAQQNSIRCPITGSLIAESEFDMHLKTLLRDPKYKEQQENFMRKNFTYASNLTTDQVYDNIKRLVRKRNLSEEEEAAETKRIDLGERKRIDRGN